MTECGECEACCQERDGDEGIDTKTKLCGYCQDIIDINDDPDQLMSIATYLQHEEAIHRAMVRGQINESP